MHELSSFTSRTLICLFLALCAFVLDSSTAFAQFGISSLASSMSTPQAGAHADFSASFALSTEPLGNPDGQLRDATFSLPTGLVGNPQAVERCPAEAFQRLNCKPTAQVGTLHLTIVTCHGASSPLEATAEAGSTTITVANAKEFCAEPSDNDVTVGSGANIESARIIAIVDATTLELEAPLASSHQAGEQLTHEATTATGSLPLFNLEPTPGHIATLGASLLVTGVLIQVNVDESGELKAAISDAPTLFSITAGAVTLWGVPGDTRHAPQRCAELFVEECNLVGGEPTAFMTNPTNCRDSTQTGISVTSWQGDTASATTALPALTGCDELSFSSSLVVSPGTMRRDSPAGYDLELNVPQSAAASGLGSPALEKLTVMLPEGTSLSPGFANGLEACGELAFASGGCPSASQVGTAEVVSPLLKEPLTGALYVGASMSSGQYPLLLRASGDGVTISLRGMVDADETTGRLTTVFENLPQLPFARIRFGFFGGATAALANPASCGAAVSNASVTSYSGTTEPLTAAFAISEDSNGGACPGHAPFSPGFTAGMTDPLAGNPSSFVMNISRSDGQQRLANFAVALPPGLAGMISGVSPCHEPAASLGTCPSASAVGTGTIAAGTGALPLYVSGPLFITGPYDGAPFGLELAIDVTAGPFHFGTALVRSRLLVNPKTLALTIMSGQFPQVLGGVPLRLRSIQLNINRPGLLLNPTNCTHRSIVATLSSYEGSSVNDAVPFQPTGCAGLGFKPRLTASTQGRGTAQGSGANLDIVVSNQSSSGTAAIRSVQTVLPSQLRPRLATIRDACLLRHGNATEACPASSRVGQATISSPVVTTSLTGPIYLVAHGGRTLPSLIVQLHSEGVTVELEGTLSASQNGAIDANFADLPDVPIRSLHLAFPRGPHSMLGAVGSLCGGTPLRVRYKVVPTTGKTLKANARVGVSGCQRKRHAPRGRRPRVRG
jgi:hypothetical protein